MVSSSIFTCQKCGFESPKWAGQCPSCGEWNSLVETAASTRKAPSRGWSAPGRKASSTRPLRLDQVESLKLSRIKTGIDELDRVLGGGPPAGEAGIVPGSVVLLAGEPGMGKSTLLTQLALSLAKCEMRNGKCDIEVGSEIDECEIDESGKSKNQKIPLPKSKKSHFSLPTSILYVCGEESPGQVKLRVERLLDQDLRFKNQELRNKEKKSKIHKSSIVNYKSNFYLLPETNVETVIASLSHGSTGGKRKPKQFNNVTMQQCSNLVIIDSIQTLWTERLSGMAGSVGQVRECANILLEFAKKTNVPVFLIGHVTKEGSIAGPKVLEHLVDTVLYLEGDKDHEFRILRAVKNRFGPTDEVGIFLMTDKGMEEVENPAEAFIESSAKGQSLRNARTVLKQNERAGSCKVVAMQGVRPVLVEIQALCLPSQIPVPRRVARGIEATRLQILCAVLQKKTAISLYNQDIFLSVAGGLKLTEPAADFGICLAITSSYKNKTLPENSVAIGEIGLLGEVRKIPFLEKRVKQAKALGYKKIIGPEQFSSLKEAIKKLLK